MLASAIESMVRTSRRNGSSSGYRIEQPDEILFEWDETLRDVSIARLFLNSILAERSFSVLTANYTFLNERLASITGFERGSYFRRVTFRQEPAGRAPDRKF